MKINGKEMYFDVEQQCYVEIREYKKYDDYEKREKEVLEVKNVSKEHIKRELAKELLSLTKDELKMLKEHRERLKTLFLTDIESVKLVFEPFKSREWVEGGYLCKNLFKPSELWQKAYKNRIEAEKKSELYKDVNFVFKYPHISALLLNLLRDDMDRIEYFINWLSTALVTLRKIGTAIVFKGIQGTGKGLLYEQIIQPIIGEKYTYTFSNNDLKSQFNKNLQNKLFVVGNEIKGDFREGNHIYETLKMWITDKDLRIEAKGKDAFQINNYFNVLVFSNNETPLQIQASDRRYTVFETKERQIIQIAKEDFGYCGTSEFVEGIRKELKDFVFDLFKFNFNIHRARIPAITKEKYNIYLASVKKSEIFANALKTKDIEFFETIMVDYVEFMDDEIFERLCNKFRIMIVKDEFQKLDKFETYNQVKKDLFKELETSGEVDNNILSFLYVIATGEKPENTQKIGTALTVLFGKSKLKKRNNKVFRFRQVLINDEFPF
ncbi:primase-helicase family protein [Caminibacter sp.]